MSADAGPRLRAGLVLTYLSIARCQFSTPFQKSPDSRGGGCRLALQNQVRPVKDLNLEQVAENAQVIDSARRDQSILRAGQSQGRNVNPSQIFAHV